MKVGDWYEENIEEGVRDVVRFLRDHGFNTCCSCHHDMTIQIDAIPGVDLQNLHNVLYLFFYENKEPISYTIEYHHEVQNGYTSSCFVEVVLAREKRSK